MPTTDFDGDDKPESAPSPFEKDVSLPFSFSLHFSLNDFISESSSIDLLSESGNILFSVDLSLSKLDNGFWTSSVTLPKHIDLGSGIFICVLKGSIDQKYTATLNLKSSQQLVDETQKSCGEVSILNQSSNQNHPNVDVSSPFVPEQKPKTAPIHEDDDKSITEENKTPDIKSTSSLNNIIDNKPKNNEPWTPLSIPTDIPIFSMDVQRVLNEGGIPPSGKSVFILGSTSAVKAGLIATAADAVNQLDDGVLVLLDATYLPSYSKKIKNCSREEILNLKFECASAYASSTKSAILVVANQSSVAPDLLGNHLKKKIVLRMPQGSERQGGEEFAGIIARAISRSNGGLGESTKPNDMAQSGLWKVTAPVQKFKKSQKVIFVAMEEDQEIIEAITNSFELASGYVHVILISNQCKEDMKSNKTSFTRNLLNTNSDKSMKRSVTKDGIVIWRLDESNSFESVPECTRYIFNNY